MSTVKLLRLDQVDGRTVFLGNFVPELGLTGDANDYDLRVYVLQCAPLSGQAEPTYYVGIEVWCELKKRLTKHFKGLGADFTRKHRPVGIAYIQPVAHRAAEGYVFHALVAKLPAKSTQRLGGWIQNQVNPSPLTRMLGQQARRNMMNQCFNCGSSDHFVENCSTPPEGAPYPCECGKTIRVTTAGQTPEETRPAPRQERPVLPEAPPAKRPRVTQNPCLRVRVCGHAYTTLSWYLNERHPGKKFREIVQEKCMDKAVELKDGDHKTLVSKGFARPPPALGRDLLPDRTNLPSKWVDTECPIALHSRSKAAKTEPKKFVRLQKASTASGCRLFRLEDLKAFVE